MHTIVRIRVEEDRPRVEYACVACDRRWEKHPALAVSCPSCDAPKGKRCLAAKGLDPQQLTAHHSRHVKALEAGKVGICHAKADPSHIPSKQRLPPQLPLF